MDIEKMPDSKLLTVASLSVNNDESMYIFVKLQNKAKDIYELVCDPEYAKITSPKRTRFNKSIYDILQECLQSIGQTVDDKRYRKEMAKHGLRSARDIVENIKSKR